MGTQKSRSCDLVIDDHDDAHTCGVARYASASMIVCRSSFLSRYVLVRRIHFHAFMAPIMYPHALATRVRESAHLVIVVSSTEHILHVIMFLKRRQKTGHVFMFYPLRRSCRFTIEKRSLATFDVDIYMYIYRSLS
jgi:hypothetical protein